MPRMRRSWFHALCLAGIASVAPVRRAEAGTDEAIGVVYAAPDGCATADEFVDRVRARAPVRRVDTGGARTFEVTIEPTSVGVHGTLAIRTADGTTVREVEGQTCDETVSALVVVAALAIVSGTEPVVPHVQPRHERRIVVGSGVALYQGVIPEPVLGVPVFATFGRNRGVRLRVGFARTAQYQQQMSAGTTTFRLTTGRLDLTPLTLARGRFDVAPAIGVEVGALDGEGTMVAKPTGGLRPWVAPDLALRFRMLVDRFALELEGSIAVPAVRDRFYIAPTTTVHEVPRVTAAVGLTLAVGLW